MVSVKLSSQAKKFIIIVAVSLIATFILEAIMGAIWPLRFADTSAVRILVIFLGLILFSSFIFREYYKPVLVIPIIVVLSGLMFFSYSVILMHDSAHYLTYLPIISGEKPIEMWDIVRGPTFPLYLWITTGLFGHNVNGLLISHYLVYIATLYIYWKISLLAFSISTTRAKLHALVIVFFSVGLNPLVFGYFHVLLTEYLASFLIALTLYAAIINYKCLLADSQCIKYRLSQVVLIACVPIMFFLRQNYLMIVVCTLLALLFLSLVHRVGVRKFFRIFRLTIYSGLAFIVCFFIWNAILPDYVPQNMEARSNDRIMRGIFLSSNDYIRYDNAQSFLERYDVDDNYHGFLTTDEIDFLRTDEGRNWTVTFYDRQQNVVDIYILKDMSNIPLSRSISIFFQSFSRQPALFLRGIADSYLASINYYRIYVQNWRYFFDRTPGLTRAFENDFIGYGAFYFESPTNLLLGADLWSFAEPFDGKRTAGSPFDEVFIRLRVVSNFTFTLGFLLLPFIWLGSFVLTIIRRTSLSLVIAFIASTFSLGYIILNAIAQVFLDRYNFPIYVSTWIAISALAYSIIVLVKNRLLHNRGTNENH